MNKIVLILAVCAVLVGSCMTACAQQKSGNIDTIKIVPDSIALKYKNERVLAEKKYEELRKQNHAMHTFKCVDTTKGYMYEYGKYENPPRRSFGYKVVRYGVPAALAIAAGIAFHAYINHQ